MLSRIKAMVLSDRRRIRVVAAIVALSVALYAAAGFWGVPRLLRSNLQEFVAEHYGRQVAVGEIRFNPFTLTLEVRDFSLPDADAEPVLAFGRLLVNFDSASLWRRGASFEEIDLERPFARILVRRDGTLNLADLAKPFASHVAAQPEQAAAPMRVFIDRFAVLEGRASFEDRTHAAPFRAELRPITFKLRDFSTAANTGNAYSLAGASSAGERFAWSGTFGLHPFVAHGKFDVTDLRATTVFNYLRDALDFELSSGLIALAGNYEFSMASKPIGLKVTVDNLTVTDLGLRPKAAAADYVNLARIEVLDTRLDLGAHTVAIGNARASGGKVRAWLDSQGHRLNLLDLMRARAAPRAQSDDTVSGGGGRPQASWSIRAPDISVEGFKVHAEDRHFEPAATFTFDPLNVRVTGFSTAPNAQLDVTVDATVNGSGKISARAKVSLDSQALQAQGELAQLDLTAFQPYIAQRSAMTLLSGQLSTEIAVERAADGALKIKVDTDVTKLRTVDNALREDFIKWERLRIAGIEYRSQPERLRIGSIVASAPYARVIIAADQSVNVSKVLKSPAAPESAAVEVPRSQAPPRADAAQNRRPISVSIGAVRIVNGSANFADLWIRPNFAIGIQSLNGSIVGLSSDPSSRAKVELEGKVDRYAPVRIGGEVNLLSAAAYSDIKMNFDGVELTTVTPYSGHFAGYKIVKGKLTADLNYHVEERKLTAANRFVINQLQLGERIESPDAVHLPLKLAVALLKDRNGVIDLDLPVTGSLDDPHFRVGPIIWKAFVGLLTKIATSPFALLGKLFGGGEEMNFIDFAPGSAELDAPSKEKLAGLLKALTERPGLAVDVPAGYAPDLDRSAFVARQLDDKLLALKAGEPPARKRASPAAPETPAVDPGERYRLLVAEYRLELGKDAALPAAALAIEAARKKKDETPVFEPAIAELEAALGARIEVPESDLEKLGHLRAQAIQDALLGSGAVDPSRVFVIVAPPKPASGGVVRLELSLK
jgi:uncharacterized protein involved in outer membrane biogenesis